MTAILLIDDDIESAALLQEHLQREGFEVTVVRDGETGAINIASGHFAIAVLDAVLPRLSGMDVLRRVRNHCAVPIVILAAKSDDADRVIGLELGADDYIVKPCTPRELTARLRAILRRTGTKHIVSNVTTLVVGALTMWPEQRRAAWQSIPLALTSTEYNLLELLARNAGRAVSKHELSEQALGRPLARFDRSVDVHLSSIRHKIGALPDGSSCIQTVFKKGYQLIKD